MVTYEMRSLDAITWRGESSGDYVTKSPRFDELGNTSFVIIMRQGRGSEATEAVFCL